MKLPLFATALAFATACNGGSASDAGDASSCTNAAPPSDAGPVDAMACSTAAPRLYVTTTSDYASGSLCTIDTDTLTASPSLVPTAGDTVLGFHGNSVVLLNYNPASQDNASIVDACASPLAIGCQLPLHRTCETGAADARSYLAIDARRGYVARLLQPSLAIVDPVACTFVGAIDLSPLQGAAALPNPRTLVRVGNEVWAFLERLAPDVTHPTQPAEIAVIDPARDALVDLDPTTPGVQGIDLRCINPVGHVVVRDHDVLVACVGSYHDDTDGAVESVDISAHRSNGLLVTEPTVHGNIDAVVALDADHLLLRVAGAAPHGDSLDIPQTSLVAITLSTGAQATWLSRPSYRLTEPVLFGGRVFVGDEGDPSVSRAAGLLVFDAATGAQITSAPIDCGLPPYDLAVGP